MKKLLIRFGLWLARLGGWKEPVCARVHAPESGLTELAGRFIEHVARNFPGTSGEFKRREVLRAMLNTFPGMRERDCALAIELAIQEYHAVR